MIIQLCEPLNSAPRRHICCFILRSGVSNVLTDLFPLSFLKIFFCDLDGVYIVLSLEGAFSLIM